MLVGSGVSNGQLFVRDLGARNWDMQAAVCVHAHNTGAERAGQRLGAGAGKYSNTELQGLLNSNLAFQVVMRYAYHSLSAARSFMITLVYTL